jgi:hypothetical protein
MSAGLYSHTTRAVGTVLTAAIYNADHANHITNFNPSMMGAYSDSLAQHQLTSDPGGLGSEVLAGNMAAEIEQIRFCLKRIIGKAQWYIPPTTDLENFATMPAWTVKIRNNAAQGPGENVALAGITAGTVADGNFALGFASTGEIRKFDFAALSVLSDVNQYAKQQYTPEATLTDDVVIAWDLDVAQSAKVTLTATGRTLSNPSNQKAGASYVLRIIQDAGGNRTLAFGSAYKFPGGIDPTLSTGAGDIDLLACYSDGTNMYCVLQKDYA